MPTAEGIAVQQLMHAAFAAQQARRLDDAERLYRGALALAPETPDALHMLGVIRCEREDYAEARSLIQRALDLTDWRFPSYRHNLGLVAARANRRGHQTVLDARQREYRAWLGGRDAVATTLAPRVAVVIPAFHHEAFVATALESVYAQTYRDLEIVVIDDGSGDRTAEVARSTLSRSPFPHRMVARENRGAAATINEGIGLATAPFVNVLNSDDAFAPERIATMVCEVVGRGHAWGFSAVDMIDAAGAPVDSLHNARAYALACATAAVPFARTTGFAVLAANVAVSTGNLFFSRELWAALGGFRELRHNHDWDFALRALWRDEPVFVPAGLYRYRLHAANTIAESATKQREEGDTFMGDYLALAAGGDAPPNPFAPCVRAWGADFAVAVLGGGLAGTLAIPTLRHLVQLATEAEAQ